MKHTDLLIWTFAAAAFMFSYGCTHTNTYELNTQQQQQALKEYTGSHGLNFVEGEPAKNTLKGFTRAILAPTTLFLSEAILQRQREEPYRQYHARLVVEAQSAVAKKHCDFSKFLSIANDNGYLDKNQERTFQQECAAAKITDTSQLYWEKRYQIGVEIMKRMLAKYNVKDAKTLHEILYGEAPSSAAMRSQCCDVVRNLVIQKKMREEAEREAVAVSVHNIYQQTFIGGKSSLEINAFGPGIHQNAEGKPVTLKPDYGGVPGEQLQIKENTYGPGVHSDQYGRPVREYSPW